MIHLLNIFIKKQRIKASKKIINSQKIKKNN